MIVLPKENKMNNFDRAEKACYERLKKQNKKTEREIEIEKKLDIAIKALKEIRNEAEAATWSVNAKWLIGTVNGVFFDIERI